MKSLSDLGLGAVAPQQWGVPRNPVAGPLGCELKHMFDALTAGPLPDRMVQLADALEEAFQRGELFDVEQHHIS
jgi:hypothetical protein